MKQWKFIIVGVGFFLLSSLFLFFPKASALTENLPLFGRVIFVDAGHGGY